ncbi:hypothetical protein L6164_016705 [Bauhinia variegata]|uniref:Uncharacterized protein n=1 Tax=Bauhinia variegata TaxID=167791 RepID=A0ACB9N5I3_BAUVA|nr:hypothetical protein L6164_016705 [Bauhinia variegata]
MENPHNEGHGGNPNNPQVRTLMDYSIPRVDGCGTKDPNAHIANFLQIYDIVKLNGVSEDAIQLTLFPFSVKDKARHWLDSLARGSISTWADLVQKFLIQTLNEHVKAITTRSGKVIEPLPRKESNEESREKPCENLSSNEDASNESNDKQFLHGRESTQESSSKGKKKVEIEEKPFVPSSFIKVPFPQRLRKQQDEKQFSKFLEVFKNLHINIPFVEALEQMPSYAKFMKELLSKKRRIEDDERIMLTEECSAILQKKLPPKLKDPGVFQFHVQLVI